MKISIDFDGVQENKQYNFSFCLSSDGEVLIKKTTNPKPKKPKEKSGQDLDDFEKSEAPKIEDNVEKPKKEFKIESSLDGKLDAGKNL